MKNLLKQAILFEKFTYFSNRHNFLSSLAADYMFTKDQLSQDIKNLIEYTLTNVYKYKPTQEIHSQISGPLSDILRTPQDQQISLNLLLNLAEKAKAQLSEVEQNKFKSSPNEQKLIDEAYQGANLLLNKLHQFQSAKSAPSNTEEAEETTISIAPPSKPQYQLIPKDIQHALNILVNSNLHPDGVLGPDTQKALNTFRQQYNVPGNFNNNEVFEVIRNSLKRKLEIK